MDATGPANAAENPLGAFLRARRELADPAEIGVPPIGRRRTPGLRREEVATLAGISAAYYTRLEQGRDANPSPQVIEALAHVLGLDSEARAYLRGLVADAPASRPVRPAEAVSHRLTQLLDRWSGEAVIVVGRFRDVLAANALAVALNPGYRPGRNLVRDVFLDPEVGRVYADRDRIAEGAVAGLRASVGADVDAPRLLTLQSESFGVVAPEKQTVYVFFPERGTADEEKFAALAALVRGTSVPASSSTKGSASWRPGS